MVLVSNLTTKGEAEQRRQAFAHALSCVLDIVAVSLAAGKGVEGALEAAAEAGDGWAFGEMRRALLEARLAGETPWSGLARLGSELGVNELNELAASTSLAGDEGAKVKQSLLAKGRSLRARTMTDMQAAAESSTERMALPIVMLMVGFLMFIGYPAVSSVLTGFSGTTTGGQ
jgi:Flp pilus assembly protein TadB